MEFAETINLRCKRESEGIFDRKDVCFAISKKSHLQFVLNISCLSGLVWVRYLRMIHRKVWPPSQTLFVGVVA